MSILTTILAAAETEQHGNVAAETVIYGIIAAVVFALLGFVTFTYRDVANRRAGKDVTSVPGHAGQIDQGAGHGH